MGGVSRVPYKAKPLSTSASPSSVAPAPIRVVPLSTERAPQIGAGATDEGLAEVESGFALYGTLARLSKAAAQYGWSGA